MNRPAELPSILPFERSLERLSESWASHLNDAEDTLIQDSVVHRFEFAFEMAHKAMRRFLGFIRSSHEVRLLAFPDLIRLAADLELLREDWPVWKDFRSARGMAARCYGTEAAEKVIAVMPSFLEEVTFLRDRLRSGMSNRKMHLDMRSDHLEIVQDLLKRHIPEREVIACGSRTKGTARKYSDLDLAIMGDEPVEPSAWSELKYDFTESDLPFMVDLVEWARMNYDYMREAVRRDGIPVQQPEASSQRNADG